MVMSVDDAYYRKMFGANDHFRPWMPQNSSTSQQNFHPSGLPPHLNFHLPSVINSTVAGFSNKRPSEQLLDTNYNQAMPKVNKDRVKTNNCVKSPDFRKVTNEVVPSDGVNGKSELAFLSGQSSKLEKKPQQESTSSIPGESLKYFRFRF